VAIRKLNVISYTVSLILLILIGIRLYSYFASNISDIKNVKIEKSNDIIIGNANGSIDVLMFGNYQCQFSLRFLKNELPILLDKYGDSLKFTLKVVPFANTNEELESLKMALAVYKYGNYDAYQSFLLKNEDIIFEDEFQVYLNTIMESNEMIAHCFYNSITSKVISDNIMLFKQMQIKGTPSFIINANLKEGYLSSAEIINIIDNI